MAEVGFERPQRSLQILKLLRSRRFLRVQLLNRATQVQPLAPNFVDLGLGRVTRRFNLGEKSGLTDVLAKKLAPQGAGHETAVARVRVLPKGSDAVGRASRRANEEEWKSLLAGLKERYRYVLIDAPGVEQPHCLPLRQAR